MQRSSPATLQLARVVIAELFLGAFALSIAKANAQAPSTQPKVAQQSGCGTMDSSFEEAAPCLRLSFAGEVPSGEKFERKFGGKLLFRLNPANASYGWTIEVVPEIQDQPAEREYVWVVTPPYHFNNVRYLDTAYGTSSEEAVRESPRDFNFVLNEQQFNRAADLVDLAISSHPLSDHRTPEELGKESENAIRDLKAFSVSKGRVTILDSRVNPTGGDKDLGSIEWLKFKVELQVPCAFATASRADVAVDSTRCADERRSSAQNAGTPQGPKNGKGIRDVDLKKFLREHYSEVQPDLAELETECGEGQRPIQSIAPFQYADLDGDGQEEAIFEGFTCMSGTAGIDFLGVLKMMPDGKIISLPIEGERKEFKGRQNLYSGLRGRLRLETQEGRLLKIYLVYQDEKACNNCAEGGEREFVYRWDGRQFVLDDIIDVPPVKSGN
jgi:hypothetical protein